MLLLPALVVIVAVLGYPMYRLFTLSFQQYGLFELIRHQGEWIGLDNYQAIFHDRQFWTCCCARSLFTVVTVSLTMVLGTLIALLLARLGAVMRLLLTTGLVLVVGDAAGGRGEHLELDGRLRVRRRELDCSTALGLGDYDHHDWFANPWSGFAVITALVVWGAIPFVAITIFAGLTQVPQELVEAAAIDGAGAGGSSATSRCRS